MSSRVTIPADLLRRSSLGDDWADWLRRLPRLAADLLDEWELRPDGPPLNGYVSMVVPVRTADGVVAALKITFDGDVESEHESVALSQWAGDGAVTMLRADPRRRALLLERLGPEDLTQVDAIDAIDACEIIASLYPRLHRRASPVFRNLTDFVESWLTALATDAHTVPVPPRLIDQALRTGRDLCDDPNSVGTLIHGDLHYQNVLSSRTRSPWLAIDPKPMSGDPHFEIAPLLWNRWDEMSRNVRAGIERRFFTVVDTAGFDEDRARDWVIVRTVLNAHWVVEDANGRALNTTEKDTVTRNVAIAKAVQR